MKSYVFVAESKQKKKEKVGVCDKCGGDIIPVYCHQELAVNGKKIGKTIIGVDYLKCECCGKRFYIEDTPSIRYFGV